MAESTAHNCKKNNNGKLAPYGTDGQLLASDVSAKFKVTRHKNPDKYQNSGPIKFRYGAPV